MDSWITVEDTTASSASITGLTEDSYQVQVRATNSEGVTPWGTDFVTILAADPPGKVARPTRTSSTQTSISIAWTAPDDGGTTIRSYDVQQKIMGTSTWVDVTHTGTGTSVTASALERNKPYDFQVRAVNDRGNGEWSDPLNANTIRTPIAEIEARSASVVEGTNAPFRLTLDTIGTVSVNLQYAWTGNYGVITSRTFNIDSAITLDLDVPTEDPSDASDGSILVTILPGTGYIVGVVNSATITITRKPQLPIIQAAPVVTGETSSSIIADWDRPDSETEILRYKVRYRKNSDTTWTHWPHTGVSTQARITGLKVNTIYEVLVRAINTDGRGGWSGAGSGPTQHVSVSISRSASSVLEDGSTQFTITLSRQHTLDVNLDIEWAGDNDHSTTFPLQFSDKTEHNDRRDGKSRWGSLRLGYSDDTAA